MSIQSRPARLALAACASLLAGPTLAQTSAVQLYGTLDVGVGQIQAQLPGPPNAAISPKVWAVQNGAVQTSYFGVRGTEDLGDGLKAKFQIESFIRLDTGAYGRFNPPGPAQDPFWSRAAWVGIEGGFGDLRLGLNSKDRKSVV